MNWMKVAVVVGLMVLASRFAAVGEIPSQFPFEDYYYDTNGVPFTGDISLQLQLYDAAVSGTCYYEDSNTVNVVDGFYSTIIGDSTVYGSVAAALASGETYVQVVIDGVELSPRERLIPQPYALIAAGVQTNAITSEMIAAEAIQEQHLSDGSVSSSKIAAGAVSTTQLDMASLDEQYVNASGDTMMGSLDMGGFNVVNAKFYGDGSGVTNLPSGAYIETDPVWASAEVAYLKTDGSRPMSGQLNMAGASITNVAPNALSFSDGSHALSSSGDTMTGPLYINVPLSPSGAYSTGIIVRTTGSGPIMIGNSASGTAWSISIGHQAKSYNASVAIGLCAVAQNNTGDDGVAVGGNTIASYSGVAMGDMANASGLRSVSIGLNACTKTSDCVAIGYNYNSYPSTASSYCEQSVGIGSSGRALYQSASLGYQAGSVGRSVAIGARANAECWNGGWYNPTGGSIAIGYAANANTLTWSNRENIAIGYYATANTGMNRIAIGAQVQAVPVDNSATLRGSLYLDGGSRICYRPQFGSGNWEWQATPHLIVTGDVDVTTIKPLCTGAELVNASTKVWWKAISGDTTNDWVRQLPQDNVIRSDLTLNVPAEYATIQDALAYLNDKLIAADVNVTIKVADGIYTNYSCVSITHRDSDKIRIIGNTNNCELCTIYFAAGQSGFSIVGKPLGYLDGFKLVGTDAVDSFGIQASYGGSIFCGTHLVVDSFDRGFYAFINGSIVASHCKAISCSYGFVANRSMLYATNACSQNNTFCGFYSTGGGEIYCPNAIASNNVYGIYSRADAMIFAAGAVARNNVSNGFRAELSGTIELGYSSSSFANGYGIYAAYDSMVRTFSASVYSNSIANYSPGLGTNGNYNSLIAK
jgi:hypothetical protein